MGEDRLKRKLWNEWIEEQIDLSNPTPLFETNDGVVSTLRYGADDRLVLKRHPSMEQEIRDEGQIVVQDFDARRGEYDGLIYMMYSLKNGEVFPHYIGKCGKFKREENSLNSNLENIQSNNLKLARWGYGRYYHIGNLSAAVLGERGDNQSKATSIDKFERWADMLFVDNSRSLRNDIYLWIKAWPTGKEGPYPGTSPYLTELEYQLIGLAFELYPESLLNTEGVPTNPEAYSKMRGWLPDSRTRLSDF